MTPTCSLRPLGVLIALALAACGGGSGGGSTGALSPAPAVLPVPSAGSSDTSSTEAWCNSATALSLASSVQVTPSEDVLAAQAIVKPLHHLADTGEVRPMAGGGSGPYTAVDFRAAYGFPGLPANFAQATPQEQRDLGLGQTIYVVVAYHEPRTLDFLNYAAQRMGLPGCTATSITASTPLPLAAPPAQCSFSVVGADANGNIAPLPGSNTAWGHEEAMDTQLAHAAAPLARIVVVAAQGPDIASMAGAISLANRMGPGIVSMSFGAEDLRPFAARDSIFQAPGMTYVAASGDDGWNNGVTFWPSAVPSVLSVGGTSLNWNGITRSEQGWTLGGGGTSSFRALPAYQQGYAVSNGSSCAAPQGRMTPDVALNADVNTGYLVVAAASSGSGSAWFVSGGTSTSAPIWAGMLAVVNAQRAGDGKAPLAGGVHQALYQGVGRTRTSYASAFYDVTTGRNGTCATCLATGGYDLVTGLGTPNVTSVLGSLQAN